MAPSGADMKLHGIRRDKSSLRPLASHNWPAPVKRPRWRPLFEYRVCSMSKRPALQLITEQGCRERGPILDTPVGHPTLHRPTGHEATRPDCPVNRASPTWTMLHDAARWCTMVHDGVRWCPMIDDGVHVCVLSPIRRRYRQGAP